MTATTSERPDLRAAAIAAIVLATVFLASWAAIHFGFYAGEQIVDTPVYEEYGEAMVDGKVPYRDFDVEYPPLALPVFLFPALGDRDYREQFEWLMAFCGCLMIAFTGARGPLDRARVPRAARGRAACRCCSARSCSRASTSGRRR